MESQVWIIREMLTLDLYIEKYLQRSILLFYAVPFFNDDYANSISLIVFRK